MITQTKGIIYRDDWAAEMLELPDDLRLRIDDAIKRFVLYGEEPTDPQIIYSMFGIMRRQIVADREAYRAKCQRLSENQKARWNKENDGDTNVYNCIQMNTNDSNIRKGNIKKGNIKGKKKEDIEKESTKRRAFVPPTPEQVQQYLANYGVVNSTKTAVAFCDYYEANGWKVGRNPMKVWQAAARNWVRRDISENATPRTIGKNPEPDFEGIKAFVARGIASAKV